ncbi:VWA domain-containing protein [Chloroflexota bacterium]
MLDQPSFYDLLGLTPDATPEEIRHAYRRSALKLHPDARQKKGQTEIFLDVQEAYEVISDPKLRKKYDKQLAKDIDAKQPIRTTLTYSCPKISRIDESQLVYVLMDFATPKRAAPDSSPPINISLIIDRSTSMQGERMDTVKVAAIELLKQLRSKDLLSIIVFSDRAEVLLPAGKEQQRSTTEAQIRMIRPAGGTEIFQGLETGYNEIRQNANRSYVNHMFLLTDGRTYGDEDACLTLAENAASKGVRITGLGIGDEWNDSFLDDLAARTGGTSFYISKVNDIRDSLKNKLNGLHKVYAEQVRLELKSEHDIITKSAFRIQPESSEIPIQSPLRLGSIPKTSKLSVLLEILVPPIVSDELRFTLATGELQMVLPLEPAKIHKVPLKLTRLIGDTDDSETPPRAIFQALSQITLYRMQERARQEVSDGKIEDASLRLQRLATQLFSLGEDDLAKTAMMEADRIQNTQMFSAAGEKEIKYGTRSLLLPSSVEDIKL